MTHVTLSSSEYIEEERRLFSLYIMQNRSIPAITDGLKAGGRRTLWIARSGEKFKTATLAGATLPIHPHGLPEGSINTLSAPYGNNIPLFKGYGAFGTLLDPTAYGAGRYTSVATSKFTKDVMFRDIDIIPMALNYDGTIMEPVHFLPLVPVALLNPSEGIAVGFATDILPRALDDIIAVQIAHLTNKKITNALVPTFTPLECVASKVVGRAAWFNGEYETINATTIKIIKIPYGQAHEAVVTKLDALKDNGIVVSYTDSSKNKVNIEVKFKKGYMKTQTTDDLLAMMGLTIKHTENLNVLDFTGLAIMPTTPIELITKFTDWRLGWYIKRYEYLRALLKIDLQKYIDIKTAIDNNVGGMVNKIQNRAELKELLEALGIINIDYIADMPVYRFTEEEYAKNEKRIAETLATMAEYEELINDPKKRTKVYVDELNDVLTKYKKGVYKEKEA